MESYVVDASIILKWIIGEDKEPDRDKALEILKLWTEGHIELYAPALWKYEVGNFLGRIMPESAREQMQLLLDLKIHDVDLSWEAITYCFELMEKYRVTFYDASYLASARDLNATLVTADEKFARKVNKPNIIRILKEL